MHDVFCPNVLPLSLTSKANGRSSLKSGTLKLNHTGFDPLHYKITFGCFIYFPFVMSRNLIIWSSSSKLDFHTFVRFVILVCRIFTKLIFKSETIMKCDTTIWFAACEGIFLKVFTGRHSDAGYSNGSFFPVSWYSFC